MASPSEYDVQLEVALCKAGIPQSIAYELSRLLPVVRRDASGAVVGIEVDGALDEGVPAGGTVGQVLTKQSSTDGDAAWATPSGAGLGDVSGPAASVDGELVLFDSTTGKLLKRAATTGLLKAAAGVLAAAVAETDYLAPAAIGVSVQAYDADLTALAGVASGTDVLPYFTAPGTAGSTTLTAAGRALLDDADATAQRATLGLGSIATQAADAVAITGGSIAGITDLAIADGGTGASSAAGARTALGLEIGTNVQAQSAALSQIAGLVDPNADRLLFWDDSAGSYAYLTLGTNLSITGTTLDAAGGGSSTLDGLSDVVITGATTGQVLKYNGTNWVNDTDSTAGGSTALDDLSDVAITTAASGDIIRHNGTSFVNTPGTTHFQAADAGLASIAGLTTAADRGIYTTASDTYAVYTLTAGGRALAGAAGTADTLPYFSAANTVSLASLSSFARTLLDDADASAARTTLGLTALATTTPGTGIATFLATPTSANLRAALTDETGDGALMFEYAAVTLSTATALVRGTHGNRLLICDTAATHTVEDDTAGSWTTGDSLFGINTSAGNVVLQGDGTATVTAEIGATLTVPAGRFWVLQRTGANAWRGGAADSIDLASEVTGILPMANGGTGANLADPGADRLLFWDDSAGAMAFLTLGTNLSITGTTLDAAGGSGAVATDAIWDAAGDLAVGSGANTAVRLAIGTANQVLRVNAGATALEWATLAGTGDVTKVGTPANNQVGVWTGDGTLEGDAALTFDTATDTLSIAASGNLAFGAVTVLDDNAGTMTLSNIDALDATTEATIEAAIDTLANLTSVQGHTVTLTGALIRSGAHSLTLTTTGTTDVTLPTSGTLATTTQALTECIPIAVSDETTALTVGTGKVTFRMPFAMTLTAVRASVTTAPTGANLIVDINDGGTSIMTTNKLSIDAGEKTSTTATTAAGITDTALADDAEITIDIDQIGSTVAGAGLKVYLIGTRA